MSSAGEIFIKICASTSLEDARLALAEGASAIGFVFATSRRQMTAEQVAAICRELPPGTETVGVFTTHDADEIIAAASLAGVAIVQLHGGADAGLLRKFRTALPHTKLWAVVSIDTDQPVDTARLEAKLRTLWSLPELDAVLLDRSHAGASGGTGRSFDWQAVSAAVAAARAATGGRLIIAGGLHAGNVAEAILALKPDGVDVASGVELSPGVKSAERVREFIRKARKSHSSSDHR